ncbi:hypothetical protein B0H16DRAFT_47121 [Mycena metata]|uniref:Uncharacterized protein n=1 Tax=Mycena metata TaxID=1033252 RepID=A0AAD7K0E0_9AGAR|nr:hypothetical protein B0H16DRAFT_47121 [Mycena metata]
MTVRHPHILQIYGAASSGRIHAAMFHGSSKTFQSIYEMVGTGMPSEYTLWIRRSSGLLCAEILPLQSDDKPIYYYPQSEGGEIPNGELSPNLSITEQEVRAIHRLSLQQYHDICSTTLSGCGYQSAPTSAMVTLGAVALLWRWGSDLVCVRDTEIYNTGWHDIIIGPTAPSLSHFNMADRSTRFKAADVLGKSLGLYFQDSHPWAVAMSIWLSQANHIFHRLQVIDNYDDYVTNCVRFSIEIQPSSEAPPPGYLFLCPPSAFHAGYSSLRWPDSPVYWSLDPLGVERLNVGEATALGFPSFLLRTKVGRRSWDANVYAGLRQFHAAKGFDPNSQDVARHLGYPLYELSNEMEARFAHIVDEDLPADVASNVKDVLISEATANTLTLGLTEPSLPGVRDSRIFLRLGA